MQNVSVILKGLQKTISHNSPAILTAIGVTGTLSTAVLAAKGGMEAERLIDAEERVGGTAGDAKKRFKQRFFISWKCYIPAAAVGVTTVACIIGANRVSAKQTTALATAYSISEKAFGEYKDKVVEQLGAKKDEQIRDAVAQDRVSADPPRTNEIIMTGNGEVTCYETITGRYFKSDMETLRKAQNDINQQLIHEMSASLNDLFSLIGLPQTSYGNTVGWNLDEMLELHFSAVLEDGQPVMAIGYRSLPLDRFHILG